jgi:hypothetical protein
MSIFKIPRDANGHPLLDRGTEMFTDRYPAVDTDGMDIALPVDCKEIIVHVEGGNTIAIITGTVTDSNPASLTDGGSWFTIPLVKDVDQIVCSVAAPTGTIDISVFAWR